MKNLHAQVCYIKRPKINHNIGTKVATSKVGLPYFILFKQEQTFFLLFFMENTCTLLQGQQPVLTSNFFVTGLTHTMVSTQRYMFIR